MHSLDLNLLKNHIRQLFQIDFKHKSGDALREESNTRIKRVTSNKDEIHNLKKCQQIIFENQPHLLYELLKFHRKVLYSFCLDYDIRMDGHQLVRQKTDSPSAFLDRYPRLSAMQEELLGIEEAEDSGPLETDIGQQGDGLTVPQGRDDRRNDGPSSATHQDPITAGGSAPQAQALPEPADLGRFAKKIVDLLNEDEADDGPLRRLYSRVTARNFADLCDGLSLDRTAININSRAAKKALFSLLMTELRSNETASKSLLDHFTNDTDTPRPDGNAFLGCDVMESIYEDMARTRLPSWVTPAPRDWGTVRRGKLSADSWRIICCIHLPITLIRLFGASDGRPRALLDNFMDLVTAVRIATMRLSSMAHAEMYKACILKYTKGTLELFPDYNVLPSHHAALHIGDMLIRFGPKHAHDSPHYERYINFFHHMNTNNHIGEVEGTFLRTAVRNANILALLSDSQDVRNLVQRVLAR
ncbi:hypothetical protein H1R20_g15414, partial [Candolleomyces eurysporus]